MQQAIQDVTEAIRLTPDIPELFLSRGQMREGRGNVEGARADYEKALKIAPENWYHRPHIERRLKGLDEE